MHIADFSVGMLGANGVVAAGMPIAVGAAHAHEDPRRRDASWPASSATARSTAARSSRRSTGPRSTRCRCFSSARTTAGRPPPPTDAMTAGEGAPARAEAIGVSGVQVDGNDVLAVDGAAAALLVAKSAAAKARGCCTRVTYRFKGHVSVDAAAYRDGAEVVARAGERSAAPCGSEDRARRNAEEADRVERSARPKCGARCAAASRRGRIRARPTPTCRTPGATSGADELCGKRLCAARARCDERRSRCRSRRRGRRARRHLRAVQGPAAGVRRRARDRHADLARPTIMGAGVGMALAGLQARWSRCAWSTSRCARMDEIVNQAAKSRFMFGGQGRVPLVARLPIGLWSGSAAQHSQSLEAWFAHLPGVVVVTPATPQDNYSLLRAAIDCGRPGDLHGAQGAVGLAGRGESSRPRPLGKAARGPAKAKTSRWSPGRERCMQRSRRPRRRSGRSR